MGFSIDKILKMYYQHLRVIDYILLTKLEDILDNKNIKIDTRINHYFYDLFQFNFDKNIIEVYIEEIISYIISNFYYIESSAPEIWIPSFTLIMNCYLDY